MAMVMMSDNEVIMSSVSLLKFCLWMFMFALRDNYNEYDQRYLYVLIEFRLLSATSLYGLHNYPVKQTFAS